MNPSRNPTSPPPLHPATDPLGPAGTWDEPALPLPGSERSDVGDGNRDRVHTERPEEVLGLGVDFERGLGWGQSRDVGNVSEESVLNTESTLKRDASMRCDREEVPASAGEIDVLSEETEVHVLVLSLSLLLLQSERDTTDGSLLDSLHQVGGD